MASDVDAVGAAASAGVAAAACSDELGDCDGVGSAGAALTGTTTSAVAGGGTTSMTGCGAGLAVDDVGDVVFMFLLYLSPANMCRLFDELDPLVQARS